MYIPYCIYCYYYHADAAGIIDKKQTRYVIYLSAVTREIQLIFAAVLQCRLVSKSVEIVRTLRSEY